MILTVYSSYIHDTHHIFIVHSWYSSYIHRIFWFLKKKPFSFRSSFRISDCPEISASLRCAAWRSCACAAVAKAACAWREESWVCTRYLSKFVRIGYLGGHITRMWQIFKVLRCGKLWKDNINLCFKVTSASSNHSNSMIYPLLFI